MTAPLTIALLFALIITVCEPLFLSLAPEMAPQLISYTELPRKVSPPHNSVSPKSILERNSNEEGYRLIFTSRELLHYPRNKNKTRTLIKFVSLEFLEIYFIYGKFKYRKNNLLLQFHFRDKNL